MKEKDFLYAKAVLSKEELINTLFDELLNESELKDEIDTFIFNNPKFNPYKLYRDVIDTFNAHKAILDEQKLVKSIFIFISGYYKASQGDWSDFNDWIEADYFYIFVRNKASEEKFDNYKMEILEAVKSLEINFPLISQNIQSIILKTVGLVD